MSKNEKQFAHTHDDVLESIAMALDIPPSLFERAKGRYDAIGTWLNRDDSSLAGLVPTISPQGSMLLGTVIRPLTDQEEFDVDLVCLLSTSKSECTQKRLKQAVGLEVNLFAESQHMANSPEEGRRCWTLVYADGAQFHMDILPAIPDAQDYRRMLSARGHEPIAANVAMTKNAIAITDKLHPQYAFYCTDWLQSNPKGYAAWFRDRMKLQLADRKRAYAEREGIMSSLDEIPDYKVKTPLQRAVQLLKRHRDGMFADDPEHKPISIIITTLAARAYDEEDTIAGALLSILKEMDTYIKYVNGDAWVENPVNPTENFADKWSEEPIKGENFQRWLSQARRDFALYLRDSRFDSFPDGLKQRLGKRLVERTLAIVLPVASTDNTVSNTAWPPSRLETAVKEIRRKGAYSKPWAK